MIRLMALWLIFISCAILLIILREEKLVAQGKVPLGRLRRFWVRNDRRRAPRYRTNGLVRYRRVNAEDLNGSARASDISETGVGLVVQHYLAVGSYLQLEFIVPPRPNPLLVAGKVAWIRPVHPKKRSSPEEKFFFVGVQFFDTDPKITAYLRTLFGDSKRV